MFKLSNFFPFMNEAGADGADAGGGSDTTLLTEPTSDTPTDAPAEGNQPTNDDGGTQPGDSEPTEPEKKDSEGEEKSDKKDEEKSEVPEKYELTAPEGFDLSQDILDKVDPVFRELGLDNEQANKLVGMHAEIISESMKAAEEEQLNMWQDVQEEWVSSLKEDPEFGGRNYESNVHMAKLASERFGSEGLRDALNRTGMGNNPEIIKTFAKIGKAISEDSFGNNNTQDNGPKGAQALFSNSNMNP